MTDFSGEVRAQLAAATLPEPDDDQAARAVRGVLRARDKRRQRLTVASVAAVVLVAGGLTAITQTSAPPGPDKSPPAAGVRTESASWPRRGPLISDTALIERSIEAWRQAFSQDRAANPAVLFAGFAGDSATGLRADIVVLRGTDENGRTVVAFATTNLTDKVPDRSLMRIRARQVFDKPLEMIPVTGFVTTKLFADEHFSTSFAFALTAAGIGDGRIVSSVDDGTPTPVVDGAFSTTMNRGSGRWNTAVLLGQRGTFALASGVTDVDARDIKVAKTDKLTVDGQAAIGDLIVTTRGVVGIVGAGGVIDTSLDRLNDLHAVDGTFEGTQFDPEPGKHPTDGTSLILDHFGAEAIKISVGTIHQDAAGTWQVTRSQPVLDGVDGAMVIKP
ncbi:hypothetical protein AB5J62_37800 [Amycolatopsis sp. cg5]|uniref:hypothetical protein n=1 Tax=Amycolatopsis sp. cg5 TaxID=3238802 RepID=UPI0035256DE8